MIFFLSYYSRALFGIVQYSVAEVLLRLFPYDLFSINKSMSQMKIYFHYAHTSC